MSDHIKSEQIDYHYGLIDMHTIDCEKFLAMDTPDALVLSILCDFKGKDEFELLMHLTSRLKVHITAHPATNRAEHPATWREIFSVFGF